MDTRLSRDLPHAAERATHDLWAEISTEAVERARGEPMLARFYDDTILRHDDFVSALGCLLADKLSTTSVSAPRLIGLISEAIADDPEIRKHAELDLLAIRDRDPAAKSLSEPFLYFKGFQGLQAHRIAHWLWGRGRRDPALWIQSRVSELFCMDVHPAAPIGYGVFIDHASGLVIGETASVGNDVSILQEVTLGGTGKVSGDRHPKVRDGVLIGAGAKILGNIEIGVCAKIGAGSVVLIDVPAYTTVAGVPARIVSRHLEAAPAFSMDHRLR